MEKHVDIIKPCCIFSYEDAPTAIKHFKYEVIKDFGEKVYNDDGSIKHYTYMWDEGGRMVIRCKRCGAIFLHQWSEYHRFTEGADSYYDDYFLVRDLDEAILLNNTFSVFDLETKFKGSRLWTSEDVWVWNKEDKNKEFSKQN